MFKFVSNFVLFSLKSAPLLANSLSFRFHKTWIHPAFGIPYYFYCLQYSYLVNWWVSGRRTSLGVTQFTPGIILIVQELILVV